MLLHWKGREVPFRLWAKLGRLQRLSLPPRSTGEPAQAFR